MILLDTNIFSEMMKPHTDLHVASWIQEQQVEDLFFSTVSMAEIYGGIEMLPDGKRKEHMKLRAEAILGLFGNQVLSFGEMTAVVFGEILAQRKKIGRPIEKFDCMIASMAIVNRCVLATRNIKDFEGISGLKVVNPWAGV